MKRMVGKRILSLLLCAMLLLGLLPTTAFATGIEDGTATETMEQENLGDIPVDENSPDSEDESTPPETDTSETPAELEEPDVEEEPVENKLEVMSAPVGGFVQSQLSLVSDKQSTLAAGVTQDIYTVYDKNGKQVKMFVATVDPSVDTVKMFTSYKDMDNSSYGMSKLTEQVAAFDKKAAAGDPYYTGTVVAGINASYYNMTTGKPSGVFVMNGNDVTGGEKSAYFAVLKDGTVKIGNASDYEADKGNIQEALGIYKMLVFDGNIVLSEADQTNTQKYPRQTIGITGDGKVILLSADGNQEPESAGLTLMEQAQVMLDLGCKWAGHLDGGGSMTYGSKPEGEDAFKIVNKPSDGSERSVSNGFIVVSTEAQTYTFDHVSYVVETEYATVGTPVSVSVSGVSSTGNAAEMPADITYSVTNGAYENGVLTAAAVGDVVLTAVYGDQEVGSVTVHAVVPEKLVFNSENMTVPFGKTVSLNMTATYGLNEVKFKAEDVSFTLENDGIGTISDFEFTAGDGSVTESKITATVVGTEITAEATIKLGKGSEVIYDFEDGNVDDFSLGYGAYNYVLPEGSVYPVTAETGKVHSGNGAMALDINYGNSLESGYMMTALAYSGETKRFQEAKTLGMWIYISDEDVSTWIRYTVFPLVQNDNGEYVSDTDTITNTLADGIGANTGFVSQYQEPGWHYLSIDLSKYKGLSLEQNYYIVQFYISDRDGAQFNYYYNQHKSYNGRYVMYVDDITIDYSDAVEDREAPVFGDVTYATPSMSDAVVLNGQTVSESTVSFGVKVADNTKKSNYTGLDAATAKAYIDGVVATDFTYADGVFAIKDAKLADGMHHVKFSICDNQGNYASVIRTINVQAGSGKATVKVVAHDPSLDKILLGSVWYADIVATDIEKVQSVTVDIDLNNMSRWELDHMDVAAGFEATYSIQDDENIATITITRTGSNEQTGEGVLASLPIRTWELKMDYTYESGTMKGKTALTYTQFKTKKEFWPIDISMEIDRGIVTFVDDSTDTFSGEGPQVDTEMYKMAKDMISTAEGQAYYNAWNGGHIHTAAALDDKAATCTEAGYTGRTFCEVCNSVVEWGETIPAKGHSYDFVDGVLTCTDCGTRFNGVWTDGKEYVDGVSTADGWRGTTYYYQNGQKLTGIQKVMAPDESGEFYYNFGEDGKSQGKYTGLVQIKEQWYFSKVGVLTGGWQQIGDDWHYFRSYTKSAVTGEYTVNGVTYQFDEQGMTKGAWHTDENGTRYYYGPSFYQARNPGYMALYEIDGKTYNFDHDGYLTYGVQVLRDAASLRKRVFEFDGTTGELVKRITDHGVYTMLDGTMYYINEDGEVPMDAGLVQFDGSYYFVLWSGKLVTSTARTIPAEKTNCLLAAGTYEFGADGKIVPPFTGVKADADGILCYYKDGQLGRGLHMNELVEIDGDIYFVKWSGKVAANETRRINATNSNDLLAAGTYEFGADGKFVPPFTGVKADADGILCYYKDGQLGYGLHMNELVKIDGNIYFVKWSGKVAANEYRNINATNSNDLLAAGIYEFGADGKIVPSFTGVKKDADGILCYYKDGQLGRGLHMNELVEIDGEIYFVKWSGKVAANETRRINETNSNGLLAAGTYEFGADGKLVSNK